MKRFLIHLLFVSSLLFSLSAIAEEKPVRLSIVPQYSEMLKGVSFSVFAKFEISPGWHIYWKEPGRFGMPTTFTLTVDGKNVSIASDMWPAPKVVIQADGKPSFEYHEDFAVLLGPIFSGKGSGTLFQAKSFPIEIKLDAKWLECSSELCIPKRGSAAITLQVGDSKVRDDEYSKYADMLPSGYMMNLEESVRVGEKEHRVTISANPTLPLDLKEVLAVGHGDTGYPFVSSQVIGPNRFELTFRSREEGEISTVAGFLLPLKGAGPLNSGPISFIARKP